jgi:hypothetical protein
MALHLSLARAHRVEDGILAHPGPRDHAGLVKRRLLFLVRKGGSGRGDCDEYRMEVCNIRSLPDFKAANKGTETAPMPSASASTLTIKWLRVRKPHPYIRMDFHIRMRKATPSATRMGTVPVDKGYGFDPEKGSETAPEPKPNHKPRTTPSASADAGQTRTLDISPSGKIVLESHATANDMPPELVTWDGREGTALKKFLNAKPAITDEQFRRCVLNYYRSDVNISRRPAEGVLRDPMAFWLGDTNEFDRPRIFTERFQHARKAAVGANR